MAHRIVKVMRRQISTFVEKKVVNSDDDKDGSDPLLEELPGGVSDENCLKTEPKNFCTMTENDQKTWIALTGAGNEPQWTQYWAYMRSIC